MYNNTHHKFDTQYNHKLFGHINRWGNDVMAYIADLKPKVIKFLDPNFDSVKRARELVPDALLIYRQWQPQQPLGNSEDEAYTFGYKLGKKLAEEEIIRWGLIDLVEGYNEVIGEAAPAIEHRKYARFHLGFQDGLGNAPVEPVAFNFGAGNMSAELILEHYQDVLDAYQWLGFHEYDWPAMDRLHNIGLEDGNGGMWLSLRYRRIMEPIISEFNKFWSVVITECGMTQGVLGGLDVGYLYPENTTNEEYPAPITPDDYWRSLQWYNSELMADDYVAGACLFTTGALSPWESFECLNTITPKIKEFQEIIGEDTMAGEPFVNDVRANDDNSLNLIPRINNFAELKQHFGLDIDRSLGESVTSPGQHYWRLVGFEVRTGVAAFLTQVKDAIGNPAKDIVVFNHWPGAPDLPSPVVPQYFSNAKGGFTDANGVQGAPYSGGAVTGPNGGVYAIWCSADPAGGLRVASDAAIKLGWIGGTDHLTANPIFQAVTKGGATPPPSTGASELRVYDSAGQYIGRVILEIGSGNGRRIALFQDGVEVAHDPLID